MKKFNTMLGPFFMYELHQHIAKLEWLLAISNGKETSPGISTMGSWHGEVDPAISRHGEPHVVRVGVDGSLVPGMDHEVLFISVSSYLSEYLEVVVRASVAATTEHSSMDEHLPGS